MDLQTLLDRFSGTEKNGRRPEVPTKPPPVPPTQPALRTRVPLFATAKLTGIFWNSDGGRATILGRMAHGFLAYLVGEAEANRILGVDTWSKELEEPLEGCPTLAEDEKAVLPPVVPAELAGRMDTRPEYDALRPRIGAGRLSCNSESTANGAGQDGAVGLAVAFEHEVFLRSRIAGQWETLCNAVAADPGAHARGRRAVGLRSPNGAVGFGTGYYRQRVLRDVVRDPDATYIQVLLLAADLPSDDPARAMGQQFVVLAKELPEAFRQPRFSSTRGPGGLTWQLNVPPSDHVLVVDPVAVHRHEHEAFRRLARTLALLALPPGEALLADLKNGAPERRATGHIYTAVGSELVEHDPDEAAEITTRLWLELGRMRAAVAENTARQQAEQDASKVVETFYGCLDGDGLVKRLMQAPGGPLERCLAAVAVGGSRWTDPERHFAEDQLREDYLRQRAEFQVGVLATVRNAGADIQPWMTAQVRKLSAAVHAHEARLLGLAVIPAAAAYVAHVERSLEMLASSLRTAGPDEPAGSAQDAHADLLRHTTAVLPESLFVAGDVGGAESELSGIARWVKPFIRMLLGDGENESAEPSTWREVHADVRRNRMAALSAAEQYVRAAVVHHLRDDLAEALETARAELAERRDRLESAVEVAAAASQRISADRAARQARTETRGGEDLYLPASEELYGSFLRAMLAQAPTGPEDDYRAALRAVGLAGPTPRTEVTVEEVETEFLKLAGDRTAFCRGNLSEIAEFLPDSILEAVAVRLQRVRLAARFAEGVDATLGVTASLALYLPEGLRERLVRHRAFPGGARVGIHPGISPNAVVAFAWRKGLAATDLACFEECRLAHDGYPDRRRLYHDETYLAVTDGLWTDQRVHGLIVQALAAGFMVREKGAFRLVAPGQELPEDTAERCRVTAEVADTLPRLVEALRRGADTVTLAAVEERLTAFAGPAGQALLHSRISDLLKAGKLGHPELKRAALRLLAGGEGERRAA